MSNIFDVPKGLTNSIKDILSRNENLKQRDLEARYGIKHEEPRKEEPKQPDTPEEKE